ncbi:hypothetical protein PLICRDRAFT_48441 [Plicaturopsis crispa FD-325 SS-3]|nr:hypothetical protein PLICRDRAFT_48441 [Plicaturopsis crispa FD-325 SS-3]
MPFLTSKPSFASLNGLLDSLHLSDSPKSMTHVPDSIQGESLSPVDVASLSSTSSFAIPTTKPISKRTHALLEILSSERAYASDLALIRDIHIPLALGEPAPFPATPPNSNPSSRTMSTASDSSTASQGPPMSREDARIIFGNVQELAVFADSFSDQLEQALGDVLEGGQGSDHVGALFLQAIPALEPPYKSYITRHPTALAHLSTLTASPTPALTKYLADTHTLAASLTHAWDISSLLIKPVQRLLKYPLLLGAVIAETPDSHPDKVDLVEAKARMESVARDVNEGQRRAEIIKSVLQDDHNGKKGAQLQASLARIKSIRTGAKPPEEGAHAEAEAVAKLEVDLRTAIEFLHNLAARAIEWTQLMRTQLVQLKIWALAFGRAIGLSPTQSSEAFDAFVLLIEKELLPLCDELDQAVRESWAREVARLVDSAKTPTRLVDAMNGLEPLHDALLHSTFTARTRPPPALLEASSSYVALRGQLAAELPVYLRLLRQGVSKLIVGLADVQSGWWSAVRERWAMLWEALRVDGEGNAGAGETVKVWWGRWAEVERMANGLAIVSDRLLRVERERERNRLLVERGRVQDRHPISPTKVKSTPKQKKEKEKSKPAPVTPGVMSMLSSLEPSHVQARSGESTIGGGSVSGRTARGPRRRSSNDSLNSSAARSTKSSGRSRTRQDSHPEEVPAVPVPVPRTKSMPVPLPLRASPSSSSLAHRSHDAGELLEPDEGRLSLRSSLRNKLGKPLGRPLSRRRRSSSLKAPSSPGSASIFTNTNIRDSTSTATSYALSDNSSSMSAWADRPVKYMCHTIHACHPPPDVAYRGLPFFNLEVGSVWGVLAEAGHPRMHTDLPLYIDDGEDCLLLVRDGEGMVGWALASFMMPMD